MNVTPTNRYVRCILPAKQYVMHTRYVAYIVYIVYVTSYAYYQVYESAIAVAPSNAVLYNNLATALAKGSHNSNRIHVLIQILALSPALTICLIILSL